MKKDLYSRGIQLIIHILIVGSLTLTNTIRVFAQEVVKPTLHAESSMSKTPKVTDSTEVVLEKMKMKWLKIGVASIVLPATLPLLNQSSSSSASQTAALPSMKAPAPPGGGGGGGTTYPPSTPSTSFSFSYGCTSTTATRTSNPPSGVIWYWQTSSGGTSTSNGSPSYTVTSTSTRYLKAYDIYTNLWSGAKSVTISKTKSNPTKYSVGGGGSYCSGGSGKTITLSDTQSGTTYKLYRNGGYVTSKSGTGSGISFTNQTGSGTYTIKATKDGCTSTMNGSASITIKSLPTVYTVGGGGSYCSGGSGKSITLNDTQSGATYKLYSNSSYVTSKSGTGSGISFTNQTASGTYTIQGVLNNCTRNMSGSKSISITPLPTKYTVGGGGAYCEGSEGKAITLSDTQSGGTYTLYRGSTSVESKSGIGNSISFSNQTTDGTYTVKAVKSGCNSTMNGSASVTTKSNPTLFNVGGGGSYCANTGGVGITLSGSQSSATYTLYNGGSTVESQGGSGSGLTFSDLTTDGSNYTVEGEINGCTKTMNGSAAVTTIATPQKPVVSGGGAYCIGETTPSIDLSFAEAGATYELFRNGVSTGQTTTTTTFGAQALAGDYTVEASKNGCTSQLMETITIQANPMPVVFDVTGGSQCTQDGALTIGLSGSEVGTTYQLNFESSPIAGVTTVGTGSAINFDQAQVAVGNYTVTATTANNCIQEMTGAATIVQSPQQPVVSGGGAYCAGGTGVSIDLSFAEENATYELYRDGVNTGQTTTTTSFGNQTETGDYTVQATKNGCVSQLAETITIQIDPLPAVFDVTGGSHCTQDGALTIGLSGSEVGTTYHLNFEGSPIAGVTAVGTGSAVNFDQTQVTTGNYTVSATTVNGCFLEMTGTATIIQSPQQPVVSGGGAYCAGGSGVSIDLSFAEAGATYELFKDGVTTGQTTSTASFGYQTLAGNYTVKASKEGCTIDLVETINVSINPLPDLPQFDVNTNLCGDKTITAINAPAEGSTLSWYWQNTSATGMETVDFDTHVVSTSGDYYARAFESTTGCWSDPIQMAVVVNAVPAAPLTTFTETNNCGSTDITRDSNPDPGWTWYWQTSELDEVTDAANAQATFTMTTGSTIYLRSRSEAGCWSPSQSVSYSINAEPAEPVVTVDIVNECGKSTLTPQSTAPTGYTWYWQEASDGTSTSTPGASVELTSGTQYYLRAQDDNNECWSTAKQVSYEIMDIPGQPSILSPVKSCGSTELTMGAAPAGETWYWQSSVDGMDEINSNVSIQYSTPGTAYLRALNNTSGCWSVAANRSYTVDEIPAVAQPTIENLCGETKMVKPIDNAGIIYRWEAAEGQVLPSGVTATSADFLMEIYQPLRMRATNQGTGCTDIADVVYSITPIPYVKSSNNKNFVMAVAVQEKGVKTDVNIGCYKNQIKVDYFDGLGRMMQSVIVDGSPLENDIIQAYEYDVYGRQEKEFLPFTKSTSSPGAYVSTAITEQLEFYDGRTSKVATDQKPWIHHQFEQSPLNRVLETYGAGQDWQGIGETPSGHSSQFATLTNEADVVLKWKLNSTTGLPERDGYYDANLLMLQESRTDATDNEADDQVIHEYTDTRGLTVLKRVKIDVDDWLDTYFIHDDWGNVVMVLPPVLADITSPTLMEVKELAFIYQYDEQRRVKSKKLPGTGADDLASITKVSDLPGWHEMIYDEWDRQVLTQDPNQVEAKEYLVTKYDDLNRPIITGLFEDNNDAAYWRTNLDSNGRHENRQNNDLGYSAVTDPQLDDIYSVTYYDDYDFLNYPGWDAEGLDYDFVNETEFTGQQFNSVKGQTTGSKVKVLGMDPEVRYLNTVTYYDEKYRVLQTISENIRGGVDRITFEYDFAGNLLKALHTQTNDGSLSVLKEFEYDEAGRMLKTWHTINNQDRILMTEHHYNEAGELVEKNLHSEDEGSGFLQSVDYRYNIRGWLTHINNSALDDSDPSINDDTDDLFGMRLAYVDNPTVGSHAIQRRYDGNISAISWSTDNKVDPIREQIFGYSYDLANRLQSARYASGGPGNWTENTGHYDVEIGGYDKNGNIQSLTRQGNGDLMDQLTYGYKNGDVSNKLDAVTEDESANGDLGFTEEYTLADEYAYDANGNMITDLNKGITPIEYNYLNLPTLVDWGGGKMIKFMYDAAGIKVRKEVYKAGNLVSTTDYTSMGQFQDEELEFIFTDEGRALNASNGFDYEYFLKDQVGNNRVVFGMLTEVDHYHATMEIANSDIKNYEESIFENLATTRLPYSDFNETPATAELTNPEMVANILSGVGPSIALDVKQGDKIAASVYGGFEHAEVGNGEAVGQLATVLAVTSSFGIGADGEIYEAFENNLPFAAADANSTEPLGYLNIIIFREDFSGEPQFAMDQISTDGHQSMELLQGELTAAFDGTAYIYVANESDATTASVLFDEFSITHTKMEKSLQVNQSSDYYPFGMKMQPASYQHKGHNVNKYNFQGQEQVTDHELNWHQFKWRNHDPSIGRFFNIDPLAEDYVYNSIYAFSENRLINGVELEGLEYREMMKARKWARNIENGIYIVGGAATVILSGGSTAPPLLIAAGVIGGEFAMVSGTVKIMADNYEGNIKADNVPNTYLGFYGIAADQYLGNQNQEMERVLDFANNAGLLAMSASQILPLTLTKGGEAFLSTVSTIESYKNLRYEEIPSPTKTVTSPDASLSKLGFPKSLSDRRIRPGGAFTMLMNHHTVQKGETLYGIAQQYGMSVELLSYINNIVNPDLIYAGSTLEVY